MGKLQSYKFLKIVAQGIEPQNGALCFAEASRKRSRNRG